MAANLEDELIDKVRALPQCGEHLPIEVAGGRASDLLSLLRGNRQAGNAITLLV
jgi:hypothetical protein